MDEMSDDLKDSTVSVLLLLFASSLFSASITSAVLDTYWKGKAIEHGAAKYHPTTGRFEWKEENMPKHIEAPFSEDQVDSLNAYQESGKFHEFTCGGKNCRSVLVATEEGWVCPNCDYKQNWAHSWMGDWSWKRFNRPETQ